MTNDQLEQLIRDGHGPLWSSPVTLTVRGSIWLNANNSNLYRYDRGRQVKAWRDATRGAARYIEWVTERSIPWERVHVFAFVMFSDRRRRDPGNWYPTVKACIDGLVDAKLILDDSTKHVVGPDLRAHPELSPIPTVQLLLYRLPGLEDSWDPRV